MISCVLFFCAFCSRADEVLLSEERDLESEKAQANFTMTKIVKKS